MLNSFGNTNISYFIIGVLVIKKCCCKKKNSDDSMYNSINKIEGFIPSMDTLDP